MVCMYMLIIWWYMCAYIMMCIVKINICRPKGENVDVKALGDYDSGMSIMSIYILCHTYLHVETPFCLILYLLIL